MGTSLRLGYLSGRVSVPGPCGPGIVPAAWSLATRTLPVRSSVRAGVNWPGGPGGPGPARPGSVGLGVRVRAAVSLAGPSPGTRALDSDAGPVLDAMMILIYFTEGPSRPASPAIVRCRVSPHGHSFGLLVAVLPAHSLRTLGVLVVLTRGLSRVDSDSEPGYGELEVRSVPASTSVTSPAAAPNPR
jgi:hypothetical protein